MPFWVLLSLCVFLLYICILVRGFRFMCMVKWRSELQNQVMNKNKLRNRSDRGAESGVEKQPEGKSKTVSVDFRVGR